MVDNINLFYVYINKNVLKEKLLFRGHVFHVLCHIFSGWSHRARIPSTHAIRLQVTGKQCNTTRKYSLDVARGIKKIIELFYY